MSDRPSPEDAARWGAFVAAVAKLAAQSGYDAAIVAAINFAPAFAGCSISSGYVLSSAVPAEAMQLAAHSLAYRLTTTAPGEAAFTPIARA